MAEPDALPAPELTIGELASMTRLTARALRHYDSIGLLHPARVDPANGYRYYATDQIVSASMIAVLRGLDVDVDTISQLLEGTHRLDDVLAAETARREREARQAAASLAVLRSLGDRHQRDEVQITHVPAVKLIGTSLSVLASDDLAAAAVAFDALFATAVAAKVDYDPDGICIIRRSTRERLHLDLCIRPLQPDAVAPPGYRQIEVDAGPTACMNHYGPLESMPLAHARLHSWILDNGAQASGCARETYVGDLSDETTRLEIPVTPGADASVRSSAQAGR